MPATEVGTISGLPLVAVVEGMVVHVKLLAVAPVAVAIIERGTFRQTAVSCPALIVHCDFAEYTLKKNTMIAGSILANSFRLHSGKMVAVVLKSFDSVS
jgi:hypothetical protein